MPSTNRVVDVVPMPAAAAPREAFAEPQADMGSSDDKTIDELLDAVASAGSTFQHVMLFNSLAETGDVSDALDNLSGIHGNLLGYHGFLSGFTFLGVESSTDGSVDLLVQVYTGCLVGGFIFSSLGSLVSFVALSYFAGMKGESKAATVLGILKYWRFFYASDGLAISATLFFLVSVQLMIHEALPQALCYVINGLSAFLAVVFAAAFYFIIPAKQKYTRKGITATRKIYERAAKDSVKKT